MARRGDHSPARSIARDGTRREDHLATGINRLREPRMDGTRVVVEERHDRRVSRMTATGGEHGLSARRAFVHSMVGA
jgi:hypothetical protein